MAEYVYIQNYSNQGKLGVSPTCFEQIVTIVTNKINGVETTKKSNSIFRFHKPVHCEVVNGKVIIEISVIIRHGCNVDEVCKTIQQEVADAITTMLEVVPFSIKIKVAGIEDK